MFLSFNRGVFHCHHSYLTHTKEVSSHITNHVILSPTFFLSHKNTLQRLLFTSLKSRDKNYYSISLSLSLSLYLSRCLHFWTSSKMVKGGREQFYSFIKPKYYKTDWTTLCCDRSFTFLYIQIELSFEKAFWLIKNVETFFLLLFSLHSVQWHSLTH